MWLRLRASVVPCRRVRRISNRFFACRDRTSQTGARAFGGTGCSGRLLYARLRRAALRSHLRTDISLFDDSVPLARVCEPNSRSAVARRKINRCLFIWTTVAVGAAVSADRFRNRAAFQETLSATAERCDDGLPALIPRYGEMAGMAQDRFSMMAWIAPCRQFNSIEPISGKRTFFLPPIAKIKDLNRPPLTGIDSLA